MVRRINLGLLLSAVLCTGLSAGTSDTSQAATGCGQDINKWDVLVLKTGLYLGKQRNRRSPRVKDHGYVFVVMGQRITGH